MPHLKGALLRDPHSAPARGGAAVRIAPTFVAPLVRVWRIAAIERRRQSRQPRAPQLQASRGQHRSVSAD